MALAMLAALAAGAVVLAAGKSVPMPPTTVTVVWGGGLVAVWIAVAFYATAWVEALLRRDQRSASTRRSLVDLGLPTRFLIQRPHPNAVLRALKRGGSHGLDALGHTVGREIGPLWNRSPSVDRLVGLLSDPSWPRRVAAYSLLADRAVEAAPALLAAAGDADAEARHWIRALLAPLARNTWRYRRALPDLVCPGCYARWKAYRLRLYALRTTDYLGCRLCASSEIPLNAPGGVTAVLDRTRVEPHALTAGELEVSWLSAGRPAIDLDRVRIVDATDAEVEAFAIQAANDLDPGRRRRHARAPVTVERGCHLGDNTLAVLGQTFGAVKVTRTDG